MKKILFYLLFVLINCVLQRSFALAQIAEINFDESPKQVFKIKKIEIIGNTVFDDSELQAIVAPFQGKTLDLFSIQKIQTIIDNYYLSRGYLSSGSLLLSQQLDQGIIVIQIIEGILQALRIQGAINISPEYLKSKLPSEGQPLNAYDLIDSLDQLRQDPLIQDIQAEINHRSPGENILLVQLKENSPLFANFYLSNAFSPSIGGFGAGTTLSYLNLLGFRDGVKFDYAQAEGLTRIDAGYFFPFNNLNSRITFNYTNAVSKLVEEEVEDFDISADYELFGLEFKHSFQPSQNQSLSLGMGIEFIDSETFILGDFSFPFTDGLDSGRSQINVLRFFQHYFGSDDNTFFLANSEFNVGIDIFNVTQTPEGIDGIFWLWQGSFQYIQALNQKKDVILTNRWKFHLTPSQLLPYLQIPLGGISTVRGYRPSLTVGDNTIIGTIELKIPLLASDKLGSFSLSPFVDGATIWNNKRETTGITNTFVSVGLALSYEFKKALEIRLDYGVPLITPEDFGETKTKNPLTLSVFFKPF